MAFSLDNYVDVPTRLRMALQAHPDLRVAETGREVVQLGNSTVLVCQVTVWRSHDDPRPVVASASEPIPGRTPYTKDSELMVGMTSALGRALGYMGFGIGKSIASRHEVEARQPTTAKDGSDLETPFPETVKVHRIDGATPKQVGMLRGIARGKGWDTAKVLQEATTVVGTVVLDLSDLSKGQASQLIENWKQQAQ